MPAHDTYVLDIYRSRALGGRQWRARLEHLAGGGHVRFDDPEALLAYLRTIALAGEPPVRPANPPPGGADPPTTIENDGPNRGY